MALASLKSRKPDLSVAIIDPADIHYYQPGWTMVGGGIFEAQDTAMACSELCTDQCWREFSAPDGDYRLLADVFVECPETIDDCSCPPGSSEPCFIEAYDGTVNAERFSLDFAWPTEGTVELRIE